MATESSTPPPVLFPEFLYGNEAMRVRKMKAEAKKWAKRYAEKGDFPEPALIPIPPGSIVFMNDMAVEMMWSSDSTADDPEWAKVASRLGHKVPRWHLYTLQELWLETSSVLNLNDEHTIFKTAFEAFIAKFPWGTVTLSMMRLLFNTIPVVSRRVEALLSFWEQLDTLRYMDHRLRPVSLSDLMAYEYQGEITMWVDQPTGNIRADLRTAIDGMRRASEDEIRARLMRRLHELADTLPRLNHRDWLKTPGVMERELELHASDGREWIDDLTAGSFGSVGGFVACLDKKYPDGVFKGP